MDRNMIWGITKLELWGGINRSNALILIPRRRRDKIAKCEVMMIIVAD